MKLQHYLQEKQTDPELVGLLETLLSVCTGRVLPAFLGEGLEDVVTRCNVNVFGEDQEGLDVFADECLIEGLRPFVKEIVSEERPELVTGDGSKYSIVMDPLDGSSNIQTNLATGTIFGIYEGPALQPGRNLLMAGIVLYGPRVALTLAIPGEACEFYLVDEQFVYNKRFQIPDGEKIYGIGGLRRDWRIEVKDFIEGMEKRGSKLRYSGSAVADFRQILDYGGLYGYASTKRDPRGKLRLVFECAPMAWIAEQAGGTATDGSRNVLDISPDKMDQRTPFYVGTMSVVESLIRSFSK
ncbi:MAG: class 1 fructose-bisphosphatase [Candidatus Thorarchaeota archaeon]